MTSRSWRPPSAIYRMRKLARRNKLAVATSLVVVFSLAALLAGSLIFALQQRKVAHEKQELADDRSQLADDKERSRLDAETKLYRALLGRTSAARMARAPGYRTEVWKYLHEAAALDIPEKNMDEIRSEVLACLGDPIGLEPIQSPTVELQPAISTLGRLIPAFDPVPYTVTVSNAGTSHSIKLWGKDGKIVAGARSPLSYIYDTKFSADGRLLVSGCEQGIVIWSVPGLEQRAVIQGNVVRHVATQPRGNLMATMSLSRTIEIWSLASNRMVTSLTAPAGVGTIDFSADGKLLLGASSNRQKVIMGWNVQDAPEKQYLSGHEEGVPNAAFSPDGLTLASVSKDRTVRIWDAATGDVRYICRGHEAEIEAIEFSPDGRLLVTGDWGGGIRVWDPSTGKVLVSAKHPGQIWRMRFDPSGRILISGGTNVICWEVRSTGDRAELIKFAQIPLRNVYDVAIHPGGTSLVALDRSKLPVRVLRYDLSKNDEARPLDVSARYQIDVLHFDREGKHLRFTTAQAAIGTWDLDTARVTHVTPHRFSPNGGRLSITADDRWAAIQGPSDRVITIYDLQEDRPLLTLPPEANDIWSLHWNPDGRRLAVCCADGVFDIWNLDEVRARLAEFGIDVPSTAQSTKVQPTAPRLSDAEFAHIVDVQKPTLTRSNQNSGTGDLLLLAIKEDRISDWDETVDAFLPTFDSLPGGVGWNVPRKALCRELAQYDEIFNRLVKLRPDDVDLWVGRGRHFVIRRDWQQASAQYDHVRAKLPANAECLEYACLQLLLGNHDEYERFLQEVVERSGASTDPDVTNMLARAAAIAPQSIVAADQLIVWANLGLKNGDVGGSRLQTLSMANYRAGNMDAAINSAHQVDAGNASAGVRAQNWLVLAMAIHRTGELAGAKRCMAEAQKFLDEIPPADKYDAVAYPVPDLLGAEVLRREAQSLLKADE